MLCSFTTPSRAAKATRALLLLIAAIMLCLVATPTPAQATPATPVSCDELTDFNVTNDEITGTDKACTEISIPEGVTSIGAEAFNDMYAVTKVTIGDDVATIGDRAFQNMSAVTSLTIGNGVATIGQYAFAGMSAVTELTIPNSVITINLGAFHNMHAVTDLTIGLNIGDNNDHQVFKGTNGGMTALQEFSSSASHESGYDTAQTLGLTINTSLTCDKEDDFTYTFNNNSTATVTGIKDNKKCTSIKIPNTVTDDEDNVLSVTSIGANAFDLMEWVTELTIPDSVTSIGANAFLQMYAVTNLTIPNSVTSIGDNAFDHMYAVRSLSIPNSVTSIGNYAFRDMYAVTDLTIGTGVNEIAEGVFNGMRGVTNLTIPNNVTSIGAYAFQNMGSVTDITLPGGVSDIGDDAFHGMSEVSRIKVNYCDTVRSNAIKAVLNSFPSATISCAQAPVVDPPQGNPQQQTPPPPQQQQNPNPTITPNPVSPPAPEKQTPATAIQGKVKAQIMPPVKGKTKVKLSLHLTEDAQVQVLVEQKTDGVKIGNKCVPATTKNTRPVKGKKPASCVLWKTVGTTTQTLKAGDQLLQLSGAGFAPNTYRATITTSIGKKPAGKPITQNFTIKKPKATKH